MHALQQCGLCCGVVVFTEKRINGAAVGVSEKMWKKTGDSRTQVGQSLIVKLTTTHNQRCSNPYSTGPFQLLILREGVTYDVCGQTVQTEGGVRVIWDYIKNIKMSIVFKVQWRFDKLWRFCIPRKCTDSKNPFSRTQKVLLRDHSIKYYQNSRVHSRSGLLQRSSTVVIFVTH